MHYIVDTMSYCDSIEKVNLNTHHIMKPNGILTALRTGAYLHHLQLLSEAPARLAEFYGSAMDMTAKRYNFGGGLL